VPKTSYPARPLFIIGTEHHSEGCLSKFHFIRKCWRATITTGVLKHRVSFNTVLFYDYGVLERDALCSGRNVDLNDTSFLSMDLFIAPYAQELFVQ
jgi:hypothetical protein